MADVSEWSQTAAGNNRAVPDYPPEGMDRQDVNDNVREAMAGVARFYQAPTWVDLLKEGGAANDFTVSRLSDTEINIVHDVTPTDATGKFPIGARCRISDGATFVLGFVISRSYAAPNTIVGFAMDGSQVVMAGANKCENHVAYGQAQSSSFSSLGKVAISDVGTTLGRTPPHIPSIDLLGDGATRDMGHLPGGAPGIDADTVDGFHASDFASALTERTLVNSGFSCWQRGTLIDETKAFPNDNGKYTADQWILLMGDGVTRPATGVVDLSRDSSDLPSGVTGYACKIDANGNVASPTAEKVGLLQMMTRETSARLNNQKVSVSFWAKIQAGSTFNLLQVGIIEWQGTADNLGAWAGDPITNWSAPAAEPILKPSFAWSGNSISAGGYVPTSVWQEFKLEDIQVSSSMTNLGVIIWIDDQSWSDDANTLLWLTGVTLSQGTVASSYAPLDESEELAICNHFFEGTFDPDEEPQQNLGNADGCAMAIGNHSSGEALINWDFRVPKFKDPTIVTYNPMAANANVRNLDNPSDVTIVTTRTSKRKTSWETTGASGEANDILAVHATAEAVL